jgi:RNA polymerase sigma-70 factor (ECF subfamily)
MSDGSAARTWPESILMGAPKWRVNVVQRDSTTVDQPTSVDDLDDGALVAACLNGRREAFDILVQRHRRAVYQICYRFMNNHEDASDLSQEIFVSTWLYRIAVNACLNRVGVRKPETEPIEGDRFEDTRVEDPSLGILRGQRAVAVRRAIAALPEKQRATLILRAYHDLSHQQIADILGSSVGAVKANFFHALGNLRKILGSEP